MLYTTHVEKVILVSTIPSNLALDPQGKEETKAFNLFQSAIFVQFEAGSIPSIHPSIHVLLIIMHTLVTLTTLFVLSTAKLVLACLQCAPPKCVCA